MNVAIPYLRLNQPGTHVRRLRDLESVRRRAAVPSAGRGRRTTSSGHWTSPATRSGSRTRTCGCRARRRRATAATCSTTTISISCCAVSPLLVADVRWVMPQVPARGQGTLDFRLRWRGDTSTYIAQNADIRIDSPRTRPATSRISMVGDSLWFHDTNVRFSSVDTHLIEQLFPTVEDSASRHADADATKLDGPPGLMRVDGDVAFDDARYGRSRVVAVGRVGHDGTRRSVPRSRRHARSRCRSGMATTFMPTLPIGGSLRGSARLNGETDRQLVVRADLTHNDAATAVSHCRATPRCGSAARHGWMSTRDCCRSSLAEVGKFAPAVGLQGAAAGPVRATGDLGNLAHRRSARARRRWSPRYARHRSISRAPRRATISRRRCACSTRRASSAKAPATSLTATAFARGRGFRPSDHARRRSGRISRRRPSTPSRSTRRTCEPRRPVACCASTPSTVSGPHTVVTLGGTFGLAAGQTRRASVPGRRRFARRAQSVLPGGRHRRRRAASARVLARRRAGASRFRRGCTRDGDRAARDRRSPRRVSGPLPPPPAAIPRDSTAGTDSCAPAYDTRRHQGRSTCAGVRAPRTSCSAGARCVVAGSSMRGSVPARPRRRSPWVRRSTRRARQASRWTASRFGRRITSRPATSRS